MAAPRAHTARGRALRAAEFFAGIGLVRLALERQGWRVVFANDIEQDKAEMYRHNWPEDDHLLVGDIHQLDANAIPPCDLNSRGCTRMNADLGRRTARKKAQEVPADPAF